MVSASSLALSVLLLTAVAVCQAVTARPLADELTPREKVQQALREVTILSDNFRKVAADISIVNLILKGPLVAQGFNDIVAKITGCNTRFTALDAKHKLTPFEAADAKLVVESFTTFVMVHQALLNTVISKQGILALFPPFVQPIRASLVSLEGAVDIFAFYLIGVIPTQKPAGEAQFGSLRSSLTLALSTYSLSSGMWSPSERSFLKMENLWEW